MNALCRAAPVLAFTFAGTTFAFAQPPSGFWQFGTVRIDNDYTENQQFCGLQDTEDPDWGVSPSQFAGDGNAAGKIIIAGAIDREVVTDDQGAYQHVTFPGTLIMTFTSDEAGKLTLPYPVAYGVSVDDNGTVTTKLQYSVNGRFRGFTYDLKSSGVLQVEFRAILSVTEMPDCYLRISGTFYP